MSDNKDYMARLSRARRRRKRRVEPLRIAVAAGVLVLVLGRSEERRVGKEC